MRSQPRSTAGEEQALLGPEEAEGVGLRDADLVGDGAHRGAVQPGLGEVLDRRLDQRLTALGGGLAGAGRDLGGHGLDSCT